MHVFRRELLYKIPPKIALKGKYKSHCLYLPSLYEHSRTQDSSAQKRPKIKRTMGAQRNKF